MTNNVPSYDIAKIRNLLLSAFTAAKLHHFCQDRPIFRPVCNEFGSGQGLDEMVGQVIDYCETHCLFGELLIEVEKVNPRQYARFEEDLRLSDTKPLPPKSGSKKATRRGQLEKIAAIAGILALVVAVCALGRDYLGWMWPPQKCLTPTATLTPAPTCAITASTDSDTLLALIHAEEQAVLNEDIKLIMLIFAPDAPIRNSATDQVWSSPKAYYTEKFYNEIHCQIEHYDFRILKLTATEAQVTTANQGKWGGEAEGCTETYENPSGADLWYFRKDDLGCWQIVRFTYNAHSLTPPPMP